jgi:hypothetical protein
MFKNGFKKIRTPMLCPLPLENYWDGTFDYLFYIKIPENMTLWFSFLLI